MLKTFVSLILSLGCSLACAEAPEIILLEGRLNVWSTEACASGEGLCGIPQSIGAPVSVRFSYPKPSGKGRFLVADTREVVGGFKVHITQSWMLAESNDDSFVATQITLTSPDQKLIATCSRYDAVDAFRFLPPGACSGIYDGHVYGVSVRRP